MTWSPSARRQLAGVVNARYPAARSGSKSSSRNVSSSHTFVDCKAPPRSYTPHRQPTRRAMARSSAAGHAGEARSRALAAAARVEERAKARARALG